MASDSVSFGRALQRIATKLGLQPDSIEDVYPCTTLQTALLVADLHGVGSYVSTFVFDLSRTTFNPQDVKTSCELLYKNTPTLRTRFLQSQGTFLQVVVSTPLQWVEHDKLEAYLNQDHTGDVQLGKDLARFAWINEVSGKIYMIWTLHHALYDEWSIDLLFDDLSLLASSAKRIPSKRPRFSKFVKALSQIDQDASRVFWEGRLARLAQCNSILPSITTGFETSQQTASLEPINTYSDIHQFSTLIIAAWSICLSKLSGSDTVVFGNIVNGRTLSVPGIVDICGPTMTTVPYVVDLSWEETTRSFLNELERIRSDVLTYEQTGFDQYKRLAGTGRYDTLISIRASRESTSKVGPCQPLRPSDVSTRLVRHPCLIYLDAVYEQSQCSFKASFDDRYIERDRISNILSELSKCVRLLSRTSDIKLKAISEEVRLSDLPQPRPHGIEDRPDRAVYPVDSKILIRVQEAVQAVVEMKDADYVIPGMSLRELGLDSLSTVAFARRLSESLAVSIPLREITGLQKTILDIARTVQKILRGTYEEQESRLDLIAEADRYARDFVVTKATPGTDIKANANTDRSSILLTGASGYLGIVILRQLLVSTNDHIVLLVRCTTPEQGLDRIRRAARIAKWDNEELRLLEHRSRIFSSDLAAPNLGLDAEQLADLREVRAVIHNGARVDFTLNYHDLEATNVSATATLLSHQLRSSKVPFFVYLTGGRGCPFDLKESLESVASKLATSNGYAQTKFTSELLLHRASNLCRESGLALRCTIVHPGIIIGDESTGVANTDDFIWRYVAASIQMGVYVPAVPTKREWINLMTTSSVAIQAVSAVVDEHNTDGCRHRLMRSGLPVARFWEVVIETIAVKRVLEPVSEWEWLRIFQDDLSKRSTKHPLFPLSQMLLQGFLKGIGGPGPTPRNEPPQLETLAAERAVAANVRYLETAGFFSTDEGVSNGEVFGRSRR